MNNIKDLVATIEHYDGNICSDLGLINHEKKMSYSCPHLRGNDDVFIFIKRFT